MSQPITDFRNELKLLRDRVNAQDREIAALRRRTLPQIESPRQVRLAKTVTSNESYPAPGTATVFEFSYIEMTFDGVNPSTFKDRSATAQGYGSTVAEIYLPEASLVYVVPQANGRNLLIPAWYEYHHEVGLFRESAAWTVSSSDVKVPLDGARPVGGDTTGMPVYADTSNYRLHWASARFIYFYRYRLNLRLPADLSGTQYEQDQYLRFKRATAYVKTGSGGTSNMSHGNASEHFTIYPDDTRISGTTSLSISGGGGGTISPDPHSHTIEMPLSGLDDRWENQYITLYGEGSIDATQVSSITDNDYVELWLATAQDAILVNGSFWIRPGSHFNLQPTV